MRLGIWLERSLEREWEKERERERQRMKKKREEQQSASVQSETRKYQFPALSSKSICVTCRESYNESSGGGGVSEALLPLSVQRDIKCASQIKVRVIATRDNLIWVLKFNTFGSTAIVDRKCENRAQLWKQKTQNVIKKNNRKLK